MNEWLKDSNGNKSNINYFRTQELAQKALDSLINCYGCINCSDCSGCSGCRDCRDCRDCSDCIDCRDCRDCSDCSDCLGCSDCSDCSGCSGCRGCRDCSDCIDCRDCIDCSDCSDCSGCSDCLGCSDCSDCSGCSGCSGCVNQNKLLENNSSYKIPVLENIHSKIYEAVSVKGSLEMGSWHTCDTTHCRAGWVVTLAGKDGKALEVFHGTYLAAQLIYRESSPLKVSGNRFFDSNEEGLADMKRMAELEMTNQKI